MKEQLIKMLNEMNEMEVEIIVDLFKNDVVGRNEDILEQVENEMGNDVSIEFKNVIEKIEQVIK